MARLEVTVCRRLVNVKVTVPEGMNAGDFDQKMEEQYTAISDMVDVRDAIKTKLTDTGGPLEGFEVKVEVV